MDKIEYAIFYATKAHKGQKRKQKDIDMIFHPFTVGMILQRNGCDEDIVTAGILHDVVEDTQHTFEDIEKEFGLRPSTATEVLKALEKKELICRVSEKQDARLKRIEFTSKAEEIRHLIAAEIGESESILLKGITEEERQIFIAIGERMLKNLDEANQ